MRNLLIYHAVCYVLFMLYASTVAFPRWPSKSFWWFWWRFSTKRVCAWCKPGRRVGGSPWGWKSTHTCCKRCYVRIAATNGFPIPDAKMREVGLETVADLGGSLEKCSRGYIVTIAEKSK